MGVKGLLKYLDKKLQVQEPEQLERGATLIVDASGFLFHIFRNHSSFEMKIGDYREWNIVFSAELKKLLDFGLGLVFVFDGKSQMKGINSH